MLRGYSKTAPLVQAGVAEPDNVGPHHSMATTGLEGVLFASGATSVDGIGRLSTLVRSDVSCTLSLVCGRMGKTRSLDYRAFGRSCL